MAQILIDLRTSVGLANWVILSGLRRPDNIPIESVSGNKSVSIAWNNEKADEYGILSVNLTETDKFEPGDAVFVFWDGASDELETKGMFKLGSEEERGKCLEMLRKYYSVH